LRLESALATVLTTSSRGFSTNLLRKLFIPVLTAAMVLVPLSAAEEEADDSAGNEIISRYVAQTQSQEGNLRGVQMDVDINANLPKLQKVGKLHALRHISRVGQVTYQGLKFIGDNTIKTDVIVRYIRAETESQNIPEMGITPKNYKFKYRGVYEQSGRKLYVFRITPREKAVGLFKGELWVDANTYLPYRETGHFVKNPSIFLKKVEFTRDYDIRDGVAFPKHIESTIDTRFWGKAEMSINFSNYSHDAEEHASMPSAEPVTQ
jgi:hypothetical protein